MGLRLEILGTCRKVACSTLQHRAAGGNSSNNGYRAGGEDGCFAIAAAFVAAHVGSAGVIDDYVADAQADQQVLLRQMEQGVAFLRARVEFHQLHADCGSDRSLRALICGVYACEQTDARSPIQL